MTALKSLFASLALFLAPWAGVGTVHVLTGRTLGTGVQPAFVPLAGLVVLWGASRLRRPQFDGDTLAWSLVLVWTAATSTWAWTAGDVGLLGEVPWAKALKQFVVLVFFVGVALATRAALIDESDWSRLERPASLGLVCALVVAFLQALAFALPLPGAAALDALVSSNPSIAAGSGELYLGHSFVGIVRLRGPMPEPLLFGSYLVAVLPVTLAGAFDYRGWGRTWRLAAVGLGAVALLATFSRGAWLAGAVLCALLGLGVVRKILPGPSRTRSILYALTGLISASLVLWQVTGIGPAAIPGLIADRLRQTFAAHDMSNQTRWWSWRVALELLREHPIGGVGWGQFGFSYFGRGGPGSEAAHFGWPVTNSLPLLVAAETGIVGLLLWARALLPALRGVFRGPTSARTYVLAAGCAGTLIHGLSFSQWNLPHLWLLVGASLASKQLDRTEMV